MVRFEGDKDFPLAPAELWARLTDARFLVTCLPDVESVSLLEADHAQLVLRPQLAFVRGTLHVDLRITDPVSPKTARLVLASKGIGSSATVEASMDLAEQGGGTRVHWVAEVTQLGGLLKLVPGGLIRGAAQKVLSDVLTAAEKKLTAPAPGPSA
jgi:carbon monoxide dehydrogenase subunit G